MVNYHSVIISPYEVKVVFNFFRYNFFEFEQLISENSNIINVIFWFTYEKHSV